MQVSEIRFSRVAHKYLLRLEPKQRNRILLAVEGLSAVPPEGDVKPLEGYEGKYRLRVGSFRVIFRYDDDGCLRIVFIESIGPRGDVYK